MSKTLIVCEDPIFIIPGNTGTYGRFSVLSSMKIQHLLNTDLIVGISSSCNSIRI